jgi:DNA-binding NarL/FixJ family response regulator
MFDVVSLCKSNDLNKLPEMNTITVGIADDHKIFRKGVILSLRQYTNISFVFEAENGEELLKELETIQPDVVLMDLRMPGKDGIETTKEVSKKYPDVKVLILTMFEDERFVSHLMENGANGYMLKNADPSEIKKAIMEVMARGYYLNNFVNRVLLKKSSNRAKTIPSLNNEIVMSDKEKEVVRLLCMEFTASEIAIKMEISPRTVESIKDRLMERFGLKNTAGLVFFAVKNNMID